MQCWLKYRAYTNIPRNITSVYKLESTLSLLDKTGPNRKSGNPTSVRSLTRFKLTQFNCWLYLSVFNCEKNLEDNLERIILMNISKNHSNDLISAHLAVEDNNVVVPDMSLDSITNLQLNITRFWMVSEVNSLSRASQTTRCSDD